jgi:hypothetical protein
MQVDILVKRGRLEEALAIIGEIVQATGDSW